MDKERFLCLYVDVTFVGLAARMQTDGNSMAVDDYEELLKYYELHETIGTGNLLYIWNRRSLVTPGLEVQVVVY